MKKYLRLLPEQHLSNQKNKYFVYGFSLIELTVSIALIAFIAMLTGAHMVFLDRLLVRAELEQLYATCHTLQRSAMMLQQVHTLSFDTQHNSYRYKQYEYVLPSSVCFGTQPGVKGPPSTPSHTLTTPITFQDRCITFTPEGYIQPGAVYLTNRARRVTYALSCAVGHVSYLRRYQYMNEWVLL